VFGLYQVFGRELCETYASMALEMGRSRCAWVSHLGGISGKGHAGGQVQRKQLLRDGSEWGGAGGTVGTGVSYREVDPNYKLP